MSAPDREPWEQPDPREQKPPLKARLAMGVLRAVAGAADLILGRGGKKKGSTTFSYGFGGPLVTRDPDADRRAFTFQVLSVQAAEGRGTAVFGMVSHGLVQAGDTVTCVTAGGERFPCVIQAVERPVPAQPHPAGTQGPPFCVLYVSDHGPEEFHPQDKFIIEK